MIGGPSLPYLSEIRGIPKIILSPYIIASVGTKSLHLEGVRPLV